MTRRDAVAALVKLLPPIQHITDLRKGDDIVLEVAAPVSDANKKALERIAAKVWPHRRVIVLCQGLTMRVEKNP